MAKGTRTNNDVLNTAPNIKDRVTRTTLKLGMNSGTPEGLADRAPLVTPIVLPINDRFWLVIKVPKVLRHVLSNDSIKVPQVLRHALSNDSIKVPQMLRHVLSNDSIKVPQVLRHVLSNDIFRLDIEMKKHKSTFTFAIFVCLKKCLRIAKESKAVNRRRTDNTMG